MTGFGLVLGGGGAMGVAWETAFLAALEEQGASVLGADVVIGTSAGALVGAQVCGGRSLSEMLQEQQLTEAPAQMSQAQPRQEGAPDVRTLFEEVQQIADKAERGRRLGAIALGESPPFPEQMYLAMIGQMIKVQAWPTNVQFIPVGADCLTGERAPWDSAPDVPFVSAVASSCCVPGMVPPVTIRGRSYIDGGAWSPSNADLLIGTGVERAIFIGPFGGADSPQMGAAVKELAEEVAALKAAGIQTLVLTGGANLRDAVGDSSARVMDPTIRPIAANIGGEDGRAAAERIRAHLAG